MKKLLITEKPSVAMEFAKALKLKNNRKDGYIESDGWIITWCVGHLVTMSYPEVYDEKLKFWRLDTLPFIPTDWKYEIIPNVQKQFNIVQKLLQREDVEEIYNAGDSGREGEYIQRLVYMMAKPNPKAQIKRVWIDSQTEEEINIEFCVIEDIKGQLVKLDVRKTKLEQDLEQVVNSLWIEYELTPNNAEEYKKPENVQKAAREVHTLRTQIKELGSINIESIEEYKKTKERYEFMCEQRLDMENTAAKLRNVISEMTQTMKEQFIEKFKEINKNFNEVFSELFGGGKAELKLEDENNVLECGIDIQAQPTGKKLQNMMLLSGGEKAFTAIALLFAILKINPAPFCVLDEIEAALDDVNVYRFAEYLKKFSKETQFLVITHRKGTMEAANTVYGVTMEENGVSKLLSMKLG